MAVIVKTSDPAGLLTAIRKAIDDGHIVTWSYDADGDFTHDTPQWKNKAWLQPVILGHPTNELRLFTLNPHGKVISREIYAIYHGRFIEMLLAHFDKKFEGANATALALLEDTVRDDE